MDVSSELIKKREIARKKTYTEAELESLMEKAYNIESREGHGKGRGEVFYIGTCQLWNRLYDLYLDDGGNCWYSVRIITDRGTFSEYEAIFGHAEKKRKISTESSMENLQ